MNKDQKHWEKINRDMQDRWEEVGMWLSLPDYLFSPNKRFIDFQRVKLLRVKSEDILQHAREQKEIHKWLKKKRFFITFEA